MFTVVVVGIEPRRRMVAGRMVTPRGYDGAVIVHLVRGHRVAAGLRRVPATDRARGTRCDRAVPPP